MAPQHELIEPRRIVKRVVCQTAALPFGAAFAYHPPVRTQLLVALALALALASAPARANGRFPAAQHAVVGPGAASSSIAVRTTFGAFVSRDGGLTFAWVCEESLGYGGRWDPPLVFDARGSLVLGLPDGVLRGDDDCAFARTHAGASALDLTASPDGARLFAAGQRPDGAAVILRSNDGGRSWDPSPASLAGVTLTTLDVAPSRPGRLWAVGAHGTPPRAVLLRSDDDGARFEVASDDLLGAESAFLSAVDARDPDRLWVRAPRGPTTDLLRSDDGGRSWHVALTVRGPMEGFALAADGRAWAGGSLAGLWRAPDGGRFVAVDDAPVLCLRHHAGALYVCTDHARDGVALARLRDGAAAPEALLRYRDAEGVPDCPGSTPVFATCAPLWREQRASLLRQLRDAGAPDAPAGEDVTALTDVPARFDGGAQPPSTAPGCGCATTTPRDGRAGWLAALTALLHVWRRRTPPCRRRIACCARATAREGRAIPRG